ncbi:hypothetical protein MLD38_010044 [Melastoma candidum]|uniref:Uncharacterized protein n=1 Tax=Melastoma candidum TaxID=119954 RepID=A0ACB9QYJ1_9MYRT|nr:hypothetical protein MLD38_010044 [Melastoma candidum]
MTRKYILRSVRTFLRALSEKTDSLERDLSAIEGDASMVDTKLSILEEEVRILWDASRKNNFDIYVLKAQADEADERLWAAASKVEKLAKIVSEGWIQIKNFEQALQFAEIRATNTRWESASRRCLFLKFFYDVFGCHPPEVLRVSKNIFHSDHVFSSYKWEALQKLKMAYSAVKDYHFEV